jgi:hypothetical protein
LISQLVEGGQYLVEVEDGQYFVEVEGGQYLVEVEDGQYLVSKDWLARNEDNVSEWSDMSTLFQ